MRLGAAAVFTTLLALLAQSASANFVEFGGLARAWILSSIRDPNIALALGIAGALGIYAECIRPGRVVPGVAGGVLLLLGLSQIRFLPINWLGVASIALAFGFFALQVKFGSRYLLGVAGTAALVVGARALIASGPTQPHIYWGTAIGLGVPFSWVTLYLMTTASRARRNKWERAI
jgi:membrane-bound ClpP family serine protease